MLRAARYKSRIELFVVFENTLGVPTIAIAQGRAIRITR